MSKIDFEKFKKDFTKIEYIEASKTYGHYPFQLITIDSEGKMEMNCLVGLSMGNVVTKIKEELSRKAKDIFLTLDLPKGGDIDNDFILALHIKDGEVLSTSTIEYNPDDGKIIQTTDNRDSSLVSTILGFCINREGVTFKEALNKKNIDFFKFVTILIIKQRGSK